MSNPYLLPSLYSALAVFGLYTLASVAVYFIRRSHPEFLPAMLGLRNFVLPLSVILLYLTTVLGKTYDTRLIKIVETILGVGVIWVVSSLAKAMIISRTQLTTWRAQVPRLFVDLIRLALVLIGVGLVLTLIWNRDLTDFLATLGIGSIVLGLALQDTLGNLMAGIALVFEHPFQVGDWIKIGDTIGEVSEMNWRAVRIRTRSLDTVVVPNSVLGKERIHNFSRPTKQHGVELTIGFSYNDPPNKVKRVLIRTLLQTRGVLVEQANVVRTVAYQDFAINYQVRFFIEEYARLPDIQEEFMTRVWYAARRHALTIPFPIRTIYKTELPAPKEPQLDTLTGDTLRSVPVFVPLEGKELDALARLAIVEQYASGERVVSQGEPGDCMYVIRSGVAVVSVENARNAEQEIARLGRGDFFGEMSLLTGEPRSANITASDDLELIVVYKETLQALIQRRPSLANEIAEIMQTRREGLKTAVQIDNLSTSQQEDLKKNRESLVSNIRRFFGV